MNRACLHVFIWLLVVPTFAADKPNTADQELTTYFRTEAAALRDRCLTDVNSAEDWNSQRTVYRQQLQEMLGLWPMPQRTDLKPVITGKLEHDEFTVEKLQFQALPKLYVTANLFIPRNLSKPAPTILYECGHVGFRTNGISYGNKAVYQTDGAWYARNGYVCLVVDTVLAGEIPGIHTGTRDRGMWWWNSRGYTPAGVEAWFGIRSLDYLCTRPEVDTNRFGITGHSGGGAYSWMVTALDDRIKAAAPLAGMADVQSHVFDGVIDSHCDCNFFINIYRWDFPQVAALAAPRPLLIGGTDNDRLFNLPNTERIYEQVRRVYNICGATSKLGLAVAPGPHDEVPELQLAVMRWFNRHLKGQELPVETVPKKFFAPLDLKVFATLPDDSINTNIADTFVPEAKPTKRTPGELRAALQSKVFAGWPVEAPPLEPRRVASVDRSGTRVSAWEFTSQANVRLRFYVFENSAEPAKRVNLTILDGPAWTNWVATMRGQFADVIDEDPSATDKSTADHPGFLAVRNQLTNGMAVAFFAPRGLGLDAWSGDEKQLTKIRRRFMVLGQTLDGMRVWDIRRAIQAIHYVREDDRGNLVLHAQGIQGINSLYATLFEPNVRKLELIDAPKSHYDGPDYLGVLKICDIPQVIESLGDRVQISNQ